jgi:acyl-CoA dehydrogenase
MPYAVPLDDIVFALRLAAGEEAFGEGGVYADLADGLAEATLAEAAKFAEGALHPIDRNGDKFGARFENGAVTTAPGWREAYAQWREGGWNAVVASPEHGGMGLPFLLGAACTEMWNGANMAFALCPLLGHGAIEALERHASPALRDVYLPRMVSGEWTATMNLTEPQAGSDLALLRTRAEPQPDGAYRLFGQKIFITYGEHDLTENIVHLVLARLPDAPAGTRGISLFLAPKFLPGADGAFTLRNDVRCMGVEHKLGIHGSPTCTMAFGESGGAVAYLIGEPNRGLNCMFTMMNNARLSVGLQGVALAERATQLALAYARDRRQGRAPGAGATSAIVEHPDVARMLLTMASTAAAARAICFETAAALDCARRAPDAEAARIAEARASLLTPLAKAFSTDIGNEATSLGVQIFGGMGFIEETGAAQLMRDARIAAIYEGTNGIQAIDLVARKIDLDAGETLLREIADMRAIVARGATAADAGLNAIAARVAEAVDAFDTASLYMIEKIEAAPASALAGATPYLRLFGLARGGALLLKGALKVPGDARRVALARFFAHNLCVGAPALARVVLEGAESTLAGGATLAAGA